MFSQNAGVRVVRGPNWMWQNQDGGEGGVGIVINPKGDKLKGLDKWVTVHWNNEEKARYRAGVHGDYDLRIYDNSTAGKDLLCLHMCLGGGGCRVCVRINHPKHILMLLKNLTLRNCLTFPRIN